MKHILITGGAGFIGSNLAKYLVGAGANVICIDNLILGCKENLSGILDMKNFTFIKADAQNVDAMTDIMVRYNIDIVYHLAANSDIRKSLENPRIDYENTFASTYGILEAMRLSGVKKIFFASSSAIYGNCGKEKLLAEVNGGEAPISYYGASKLASEAFISSYTYINQLSSTIFRFPNVIGKGLTHGVIFDFISKLKSNTKELEILGDGNQRKPYIHISDLINAMTQVIEHSDDGVNLYNVGVESSTSVTEIADYVCTALNLKNVVYRYSGGETGWLGDVPYYQFNLKKIYSTGWKAKFTSKEAIIKAIDEILEK